MIGTATTTSVAAGSRALRTNGLGRLIIDPLRRHLYFYGDYDVRLNDEFDLGEWGNFAWALPDFGPGDGASGASRPFKLPELPDLPSGTGLGGLPIEGDASFELIDKTLDGWVYAKLPPAFGGLSGKLFLAANNDSGLVFKDLGDAHRRLLPRHGALQGRPRRLQLGEQDVAR